jgi:hypothetical protein
MIGKRVRSTEESIHMERALRGETDYIVPSGAIGTLEAPTPMYRYWRVRWEDGSWSDYCPKIHEDIDAHEK